MEEFLLPCLNKQLFGLECYGCGGQRAILLLLEGNFIGAFEMFPAIYPLAVLLIFVLINIFIKFKFDFSIKIGLIILTAGTIMLNYLIKMFYLFN
ncbi:MAG: DUF2752 domain-containing protein [Bacteroidota bacterium]